MSILKNLIGNLLFEGHGKTEDQAQTSVVDNTQAHVSEIERLCNDKNYQEAWEASTVALNQNPENATIVQLRQRIQDTLLLLDARENMPGPNYHAWLQWFHDKLRPKNYLEIGVDEGESLRYAKPPTLAVGVDPNFNITHQQENWVKLFKQTSDDFFKTLDCQKTFGSQHIELAFIDGLHTFDQVLRDFINIEKYSDTNSVVLFHDIYPLKPITAQREPSTRFWLGDPWKTIILLLKYRKDLNIFTIPAYPSGLCVVTNLDNQSNLLDSIFDDISVEAQSYHLDNYPNGLKAHLNAIENSFDEVARRLSISV